MYDNHKKIYPTSLIQFKEENKNFMSEQPLKKNKMQCGCRFIKQNIVHKSNKPSDSFIEVKTNAKLKPERETVIKNTGEKLSPVNSYMESIASSLKDNTIMMTKIEHFLQNQQTNFYNNNINQSPYMSNFNRSYPNLMNVQPVMGNMFNQNMYPYALNSLQINQRPYPISMVNGASFPNSMNTPIGPTFY